MIHYILCWLSQIVQEPNKRLTGSCLVILAKGQGIGKSSFADMCLDIFSPHAKKITSPEHQLFSNFTDAWENSLFLLLDDPDSKVLRKHAETFKGNLTDKLARVRALYKSDRFVESYARVMIVSNKEEVLEIEPETSNRRFTFIKCSPANKLLEQSNENAYFTRLHSYWGDKRNRQAVLKFLLRYPINGFHPEHSRPRSSILQNLEYESLSYSKRVLFSMVLSPEFIPVDKKLESAIDKRGADDVQIAVGL